VALAGSGALGVGAYDYYRLRQTVLNTRELEHTVTDQGNELVFQRKQIQNFANEVNELKSKLLSLNTFEKQIRMIANLEKGNENSSIFGVGGTPPEDMNPKLKLTEKHGSLIREIHQQTEQLHQAAAVQQKQFESLMESLGDQKNLLASTPAILPVHGIFMSGFGWRNSPFTGLGEFHKGIDISNQQGTPVTASADGTVSFAGHQNYLGNVVMIHHGHGLATCYAHLQKTLKEQGDKVRRGEKIGLLGNTGKSTGPHLHYEVHLNGTPVDPKKYILN
jgi:murein DD-endopeptidase MepM/ murein hydrolase activator NlpD